MPVCIYPPGMAKPWRSLASARTGTKGLKPFWVLSGKKRRIFSTFGLKVKKIELQVQAQEKPSSPRPQILLFLPSWIRKATSNALFPPLLLFKSRDWRGGALSNDGGGKPFIGVAGKLFSSGSVEAAGGQEAKGEENGQFSPGERERPESRDPSPRL